jgi:hypothetical protein
MATIHVSAGMALQHIVDILGSQLNPIQKMRRITKVVSVHTDTIFTALEVGPDEHNPEIGLANPVTPEMRGPEVLVSPFEAEESGPAAVASPFTPDELDEHGPPTKMAKLTSTMPEKTSTPPATPCMQKARPTSRSSNYMGPLPPPPPPPQNTE